MKRCENFINNINLSLSYCCYIIQGLMTYLEIGSDTRVRTNIISSADRVEYAEVNHTQHQNSFKSDIGKFTDIQYQFLMADTCVS